MPDPKLVDQLCENVMAWGLMTPDERESVAELFAERFAFAEQLDRAETIHIHIKVDDTTVLPREKFKAVGGELDHEKEGFVKFLFPGGANLIFSSIQIADDETSSATDGQRPRPFVDHCGIDLRSETADVASAFASVPAIARREAWGHVPQGGADRGVHCCHVEIKQKHWVYPRSPASPIPLEFAFGELKVNRISSGCDLRPADPAEEAVAARTPCGDDSPNADDNACGCG